MCVIERDVWEAFFIQHKNANNLIELPRYHDGGERNHSINLSITVTITITCRAMETF